MPCAAPCSSCPGSSWRPSRPDSNRSATARSITTRTPLWVEEVELGDGTTGYATDGTPVDCVRFAALGLIEFEPELIVSGINHGSNLGDDITYSGTVAAALEGIVLGVPAIAASQQADPGQVDFRAGRHWQPEDFEAGARFVARMVEELQEVPMPEGTLLNVNCPAGEIHGARACKLGKRIYRDRLELAEERTAVGGIASTGSIPATTTRTERTSPRWPTGTSRSRRCTST